MPVADVTSFLELEWSWLNFVVTWLEIFKPNDSTKKLSQMVLSQVTGNPKHLLLESTTKSVESGTNDVICQFCTVKGMVVESEILKALCCASSK